MQKRTNLGFSIAEAMIVLLVTSIALAAAAPLFSRRNQVTNSGNSKWLLTRNNTDISRARGRVGIGVPTSSNPEALLELRGNDAKLLSINNNGNEIFSVTNNGLLSLNFTTNSPALSVNNNGTETVSLNSNGRLNLNNPTDTNARAVSIRQNGTETAWINSDGTSSFEGIPRGAVMFFNLASCPTGWSKVNNAWNGRFLRIANDTYTVGFIQEDEIKSHNHGLRLSPGDAGFGDSVGTDGYGTGINREFVQYYGGEETRPKSVALLACVKN